MEFDIFTLYKPKGVSDTNERSRTSSKSSKSDNDDFTMKDVLELFKSLDGLNNEMSIVGNSLLQTLQNTLNSSKSLNPKLVAVTYLKELIKLKQLKRNKDFFDEVYKNSVQKNTIDDFAIENGRIYVYDKNKKIKAMPIEQYAKIRNQGIYRPLTCGNLLWLRQNSNAYVNRNDIFQIVDQSVSIESVNKMINDRFKDLGSTETSNSTFISKDVAKGAEILNSMLAEGPEGYYKITQNLTSYDKNQLMSTLNYIYSSLPRNARDRLRVETKTGSHEEALSLIQDRILGTIDGKSKYDAVYIGTNKSINKASKEKGLSDDIKLSTAAQFYLGYGDKQRFIINPGTSSSILAYSNIMPLTNKNNHNLGANKSLQEMSEGLYNGILDLNNVSMGGHLIKSNYFNEVIISDGKIASIDFPCKVNDDGSIVPILSKDIIDKKNKADKEISEKGINLNDKNSRMKNYAEINRIYKENKLPSAYDSNGELSSSSWARFGVMNAQTNNHALGIEDTFDLQNLLVEEKDVSNYMKLVGKEDWDPNDKLIWEGSWDGLYKGTLWIPIRPNLESTLEDLDTSEALNIDAKTQAQQTGQSLTLGRQL